MAWILYADRETMPRWIEAENESFKIAKVEKLLNGFVEIIPAFAVANMFEAEDIEFDLPFAVKLYSDGESNGYKLCINEKRSQGVPNVRASIAHGNPHDTIFGDALLFTDGEITL